LTRSRRAERERRLPRRSSRTSLATEVRHVELQSRTWRRNSELHRTVGSRRNDHAPSSSRCCARLRSRRPSIEITRAPLRRGRFRARFNPKAADDGSYRVDRSAPRFTSQTLANLASRFASCTANRRSSSVIVVVVASHHPSPEGVTAAPKWPPIRGRGRGGGRWSMYHNNPPPIHNPHTTTLPLNNNHPPPPPPTAAWCQ